MNQTRKIVIATFGSLGDLHPFVALAHALKSEGFTPVIATSGAYAEYIAAEGLAFAPIRPDAEELTQRLGMDLGDIARRMAENDGFLFNTLIFPHLRESYEDLLLICNDATAVVAHALAFSARLVAEVKGVPLVNVLLSPMMLYSAYDPPFGSRAPFRREPAWAAELAYNRFILWSLSHLAGLAARPLRRIRRELGLPRRHGLELLLGVESGAATIGLFSPALAPPQPDHLAKTLVAGHTFHDRYFSEPTLSPALEAFLARGEAPIVFTLGSFVARKRVEHYRACVVAARQVGRRGVLLVHEDDADILRAEASPEIHVTAYAPHSQIFPRACAVVQHGGIGTTGQALRAARPQVVTPYLGDQYDNAARLARLGVARIVKGEDLTPQSLERALDAVLKDSNCAYKARSVAAMVEADDGAAVAAKRIAAIVSGAAATAP